MQTTGERISVKAAGIPRAAPITGDGMEAERPRQAAIAHLTDGIWWSCFVYRQ